MHIVEEISHGITH